MFVEGYKLVVYRMSKFGGGVLMHSMMSIVYCIFESC